MRAVAHGFIILILAILAGGARIGNAAPALLLGGAVAAEIGMGMGSTWRPAIRLTVAGATSGTAELGSGAAIFTLIFARVEGCPLVVRAGTPNPVSGRCIQPAVLGQRPVPRHTGPLLL